MLDLKIENSRSNMARINWPKLHVQRLTYIQNVLPLDGPSKPLGIGGKILPGEMAVFDDHAANAVLLDAEEQIKSGYPTIATSSIVNNKRQRQSANLSDSASDSQSDIKFLSELVKPIQYRWKFQKENLKTISPSKHGYHPRSRSPTFQRLIEATEKLQVMTEDDDEADAEDFFDESAETKSQVVPLVTEKTLVTSRYKSEPLSTRTSLISSTPTLFERQSPVKKEIKPEVRNFDIQNKEKEDKVVEKKVVSEDKKRELSFPEEAPKTKATVKEFKVDFKKHDSYSELHLFLPHIQDAMSRGATPEHKQTRIHHTNTVLPSIHDVNEAKLEDKLKNKGTKRKNDIKKKKKGFTRNTSGFEEKEYRDRLNDVPTLISLENEKVDTYHPASMCVFENCQFHQHRKSNKLRQP